MTGVIWIIQVLHYPVFLRVVPMEFPGFHQTHSRWMGFLVGPPMIVELVIGLFLIGIQFNFLAVANLFLVVGTWVVTFLISVPIHNQLSKGFNKELINRLVSSNWSRTLFWSLKLILAMYLSL